MNALTLALLLSSTSANPSNSAAAVQTTSTESASATQAKAAADAKEDCDDSNALMKKLNADKKIADAQEQKAAADQAVNGLASLGLIPAEKVEEKKADLVIAAPKMESCR